MSELDKILKAGRMGRLHERRLRDARGRGLGLPEPDGPISGPREGGEQAGLFAPLPEGGRGLFQLPVRRTWTATASSGLSKEGQIIDLRFAGTKIWEVTITGLNLWQLYDGIHRHVIPWVRKSDRGFASGAGREPLIMGIDIKEIEREG